MNFGKEKKKEASGGVKRQPPANCGGGKVTHFTKELAVAGSVSVLVVKLAVVLGHVLEQLAGLKLRAKHVLVALHAINQLAHAVGIMKRKGPPRKGAKPMPNTAPMSPAVGSVMMSSWRQRAVSSQKRDTMRSCRSSSESRPLLGLPRCLMTSSIMASISGLTVFLPLPAGKMCMPLPLLRPYQPLARTWSSIVGSAVPTRAPRSVARNLATLLATSKPTSSISVMGPTGKPNLVNAESRSLILAPSRSRAMPSSMKGPR